MSNRSAQAAALQDLTRPRPPETLRARVAIVGAAVALAVTAHLLMGGRWTWVLFGFVGIVSLLVSLPRLGWLAKPVGAYVGLWLVFNLFRAGADDTDWADVVLGLVPRLEAWLFGGQLPSGLLQEWFYSAGDFDWFDYGLVAIYLSFFVVPHAIAILLLWRNRQLFWQYALSFLVLFTLSAASFYLMPTSPPWLVSEIVSEDGYLRITRINEPVLATLDLPFQLFNQGSRDSVRTSEVRMEPNPIAAMPSIHFAATALIIFPARLAGRALYYAAIVYTLLMGIALVYLGEHYVLDLLVGGAMVLVSWALAGRWISEYTGKGKAE